jgi:hypothetical protein
MTEAPRKDLRWVIIAAAVIFVAVAIAVVFIRDAQTPPTPVALPLTQTFDDSPTGFTLKYPEEWQYIIPAVGVLVMGPPQTLFENEPGPSLTIQRSYPLSISGSLEGALDGYLQAGPLNGDGLWQVTLPVHETMLDNREARTVELEGSNAPGIALLHTRITATAADNTFVYLVVASAPADRVANFTPTLNAILQTFEILE